jgi:hypothetical protein
LQGDERDVLAPFDREQAGHGDDAIPAMMGGPTIQAPPHGVVRPTPT